MFNFNKKLLVLLCLVLALVMLLALVSCGGDSGDDDGEKDTDGSSSSSGDIGAPGGSKTKYFVYFDSDGGSTVDAIRVERNKKATKPENPTREGYIFAGWYNGEEQWDFSESVTSNITLKAKWNPKDTALTYFANGGEGKMDSKISVTDATITLDKNTFTRAGYTFKGWATEKDGEAMYADGAQYKMGTEDSYTLYAVWEANKNTLILVANNGTDRKETLTLKTGEVTDLSTVPFLKLGYSIVGWSSVADGAVEHEAGVEYTMGTKSEYTLYAIWEINNNDIVLDMNDGTGERETHKLESFESFNLPLNTYTRAGYNFKGWSTTADGEVEYADGDLFESQAEKEVVFYAVWEAITYTITYHNAPELGYTETTFTAADLPITLPKLSNTSNKLFDAWYDNEELGGLVRLKVTEPADIDLYPSFVDGTDGLLLIEVDDEYQVAGYTGTEEDVVIPNYYRGKPVTKIAKQAFSTGNATSIKSIQLPILLREIADEAFKGCNYLADVELPETLEIIGSAAFLSCYKVNYLTIPRSVTSIGKQAFSYSGIKSIEIPAGITSLDAYAFYGCKSLERVVLPEGFTEISKEMFYDCWELTDVILPSTIKTIDKDAFRNCEGLIAIEIPSGVTEIDDRAFYGCDFLETVVLPNTVTDMGDGVFGFCKKLKTVNIPTGVTRIGAGMFNNCLALESIAIPNGVKSIEDNAFSYCWVLDNVVIPSTVTSIGDNAFSYCYALTDITLSTSLRTIGSNAFEGCRELLVISIPKSVTTIGSNAFKGCTGVYIYCEVDAQPAGWSSNWNPEERIVTWGEMA